MNSIIRAYVPKTANEESIKLMMLGHGGYTVTSGVGAWQGTDKLHKEPVAIYECIVQEGLSRAAMQLAHAGRVFLNDNRNEQAFLGVVIGDGVKRIYLEQEQQQ